MRKIKIVLAMTFMFSVNAYSQMGQMGSNRMMQNNQQPTTSNPEREREEMEKARKENLEKILARLTTDINLDALQQVAIRQLYDDNMKKQGIIMKKEISDDDKVALLKSLGESTEVKVLELLNKEQKEKYELLKNNKLTPTSKKKKKKEKK
jgi:hypothetical protein